MSLLASSRVWYAPIKTCAEVGLALVLCFAVSLTALAQTPAPGVFTSHNDLARTGQNLNETILTPASVNPSNFGLKFANPVDARIYAQPLYVSNVAIPGKGTHNVVYVATENDTVYAFDADTQAAPLWQRSLLINGGTAVPSSDVWCSDLVPIIGVTSTPVIDPTTNTLYVVAKTKEGPSTNPSFFQRLHALDLATGAERPGAPVDIAATVSGRGDGSDGTSIAFDPHLQLNRLGLALVGGLVYIGFGSHCDNPPYHGWLFAYDATHLTPAGVFITTPNGRAGGIWQAGVAIAADASGNLYLATGNGTFDANLRGGSDLGSSVVKLSHSGAALTVSDYFTPFDQNAAYDNDVGSGGPLALPDQTNAQFPHLLVSAGKDGTIYLLNRDNLGQFCNGCASDTQIVQSLRYALGANFGTPAIWNSTVYFSAANDVPKAFSLTKGLLSTSPTSKATTAFGFPGATLSVSANGTTDGIVWALQTDAYATDGPAVLHAYDANDLTNELYNSSQAAGGRDTLGPAVKFTVPTVVNGNVYVGTASELDVLGLLTVTPPIVTPPIVSSLSLSPTSVTGGGSSTGTVTLNAPAPAGGAQVALSSSDPAATTPASVTVAAGATSATFSVATGAVAVSTPVTISASYGGATQTASLTVLPAVLSSLSLNPSSVMGGPLGKSTGTVTLNGAAAAGGAVVALSSNSSAGSVPPSVTIAAGATSATFTVNTAIVVQATDVTITASYNGTTRSAKLHVTNALGL